MLIKSVRLLFFVAMPAIFPLVAQSTLAAHLAAQEAGAQPKAKSIPANSGLTVGQMRASAYDALDHREPAVALEYAAALVRDHGQSPSAMIAAGDVYLRAGKPELAVTQFDRYLTAVPQQLPGLWQRGIALFFAGKYDQAADQFEKHRVVNPNDVENAAWHFLCIAKAKSPEKAKEMLLPAPGDRRIPMKEILNLFATGDTDSVIQGIKRAPANTVWAAEAKFYGELYLGIYADAMGQADQATQLIDSAAKDAPAHYMGDVARTYQAYLKTKTAAGE